MNRGATLIRSGELRHESGIVAVDVSLLALTTTELPAQVGYDPALNRAGFGGGF